VVFELRRLLVCDSPSNIIMPQYTTLPQLAAEGLSSFSWQKEAKPKAWN